MVKSNAQKKEHVKDVFWTMALKTRKFMVQVKNSFDDKTRRFEKRKRSMQRKKFMLL